LSPPARKTVKQQLDLGRKLIRGKQHDFRLEIPFDFTPQTFHPSPSASFILEQIVGIPRWKRIVHARANPIAFRF
jgi:hypothetical protein